jgi:hypothetical protein
MEAGIKGMCMLRRVPARPGVDQTVKRLMDVGNTANRSYLADVNAAWTGEPTFIHVRLA